MQKQEYMKNPIADYETVVEMIQAMYPEVSGYDFYRDIFPDNEKSGEIGSKYLKPNAVYLYQDEADLGSKRRLRRRIMLNDTWEQDYMDFVERNPMTLCSGLSYRGRKMWQRETVQANDWNRREKVEEWRKRWADCCNKYLARELQIDHRSYERQGVTQLPTVHEGYAARLMEQRGTVSDLCQRNRDIRLYNHIAVLYQKSKQELKLLEQEIAKAKEPDFRELRLDGCRLAEKLLHKYGNQWAEKRAQEEFTEKTRYRQSYIDMFLKEIKETEEKYKKKALKERGLFAKMLGSDGMTDKIKEEMADATRYLRRRLAEERQALPNIPDTDSYNRYWYNIYKSNDADRKMSFAMSLAEEVGAQNDQDYLQLKKVYDKFEPINRKIERKERMEELARYNANYRNRFSRDNQYTID